MKSKKIAIINVLKEFVFPKEKIKTFQNGKKFV